MTDQIVIRPCFEIPARNPMGKALVEWCEDAPERAQFWGAYWKCPEGLYAWVQDFSNREEAEAFAALLNT